MNTLNQILPHLSRTKARNTESTDDNGEGGLTIKPFFEVQEKPDAWALTVQLPGVTKENLDFTAENDRIIVNGRRTWQKPDDWTALYRESIDVPYKLVLEHDNNVDVVKIAAEFKDGILHVSLPKVEALKPRKITIT